MITVINTILIIILSFEYILYSSIYTCKSLVKIKNLKDLPPDLEEKIVNTRNEYYNK